MSTESTPPSSAPAIKTTSTTLAPEAKPAPSSPPVAESKPTPTAPAAKPVSAAPAARPTPAAGQKAAAAATTPTGPRKRTSTDITPPQGHVSSVVIPADEVPGVLADLDANAPAGKLARKIEVQIAADGELQLKIYYRS